MNPKAGEYQCSDLSILDVGISARYHWSVARQLTSYSRCHWNLRNLTLQQECSLTNTRDFFRNTRGSIMLPPRQPHVSVRLGSLAWLGLLAIMVKASLDAFKAKDTRFVVDWLKSKVLHKLCSVFEGIQEPFVLSSACKSVVY